MSANSGTGPTAAPATGQAGDLNGVAEAWEALGREDALWAVLTERGKRGRWSADEFLGTGAREIQDLLNDLSGLGLQPRRDSALDFGCGAGRLTQGLARAGFSHVFGVDVSPSMVEHARTLNRFGERCTFILNRATSLEAIETESVDLVYTSRVLQHMPPELAHAYIVDFFRIARPDGLIVFQIPNAPAATLKGLAIRLLPEPVLTRLRRGMEMHGTSDADVRALVRSAGGEVVAATPTGAAGPGWVDRRYVCRLLAAA